MLMLPSALSTSTFRRSPTRFSAAGSVGVSAGNSGDLALLPQVEVLLSDASPLVRAMAVWALKELSPERAAELKPAYLAREADRDTAAEWDETKVAA